MALQYPLLFPYREDGFHDKILYHSNTGNRKTNCGYVTMKEYFSYTIHHRKNEGTTLIRGGRLFQQYLVDAFAAIEEQRLKCTRNNQYTLCVDLYHNVCDAVTRGDTNAAGLGKRIVLPASFTGGPRYMMQNYQDAMAICRAYGNPDLFITFTSNPKRSEISGLLSYMHGQKPHDRSEVGTRVFKLKLTELLHDLQKNKSLANAVQRGLTHAHILVWLEEDYKCKTTAQIDDIISSELPSLADDPDGHQVVSEYMLHGPCGPEGRYAPCTTEGKCTKRYPKLFYAKTMLDDDGYPIHHRRDNKVCVKKGKFTFDNRHVVPHSRYLLLKYRAHINVEWCNRSKSIKYIFKYLSKGPDRATVTIQENVYPSSEKVPSTVVEFDEIKNYLNCRYLAPCEAVWRMLSFDIHYSYPSVMKLNFHLQDQNLVMLRNSDNLPTLLQKEGINITMFSDWFDLNDRHPPAISLTYAEIPTYYVWHEKDKMWKLRKQKECIGMIVYSTPASGKRYYLRILLNVVRGPRKFETLLTMHKRVCATFKQACFAYGLLSDDKEWTHAISEASGWALGPKLRDMFVTILLFCDVSRPLKLWEETWELLSDDILFKKKETFQISRFAAINRANKKLLFGLNSRFTEKKWKVIESVHIERGAFYFVYGPGGTGKIFLYKTIISRIRSEGKIALAVASSGGRTAYSRFVIPLELLENSTCGIKQNTHLAELMQEVALIIWDEAPMTQKYAFEALDKTQRDILGFHKEERRNKVFGGMTVLLGGDFRQIFPVIPKGKRLDVIQVCINRSELWKHCSVFRLTRKYNENGEIDTRKQDFNQWVLAVGDGTLPAQIKEGEDEPIWIHIPREFLIKPTGSPIEDIVAETYPDFLSHQHDDDYLEERAILTTRNDDADAINAYMFKKLTGLSVTYNSADEVCKASTEALEQHHLFPTEFLNTLNFPGMPPHALCLKKELPIMLLRNINPASGLCNETRLIITELCEFVIRAKIITGSHVGNVVDIHRIILSSTQTKWPFVLKRRQYPMRPCYVMTINKSQGQSLNYAGLYLPNPVFSHGQLYVAMYRFTTPDGLKILMTSDEDPKLEGCTRNIVYKEVFSTLS